MSARKKRGWLANFATTTLNTTLWRNRLDICLRCKTFLVRTRPTTAREKEEEEMDHRVFRDVTGPSMTSVYPYLMTSSLGASSTMYYQRESEVFNSNWAQHTTLEAATPATGRVAAKKRSYTDDTRPILLVGCRSPEHLRNPCFGLTSSPPSKKKQRAVHKLAFFDLTRVKEEGLVKLGNDLRHTSKAGFRWTRWKVPEREDGWAVRERCTITGTAIGWQSNHSDYLWWYGVPRFTPWNSFCSKKHSTCHGGGGQWRKCE